MPFTRAGGHFVWAACHPRTTHPIGNRKKKNRASMAFGGLLLIRFPFPLGKEILQGRWGSPSRIHLEKSSLHPPPPNSPIVSRSISLFHFHSQSYSFVLEWIFTARSWPAEKCLCPPRFGQVAKIKGKSPYAPCSIFFLSLKRYILHLVSCRIQSMLSTGVSIHASGVEMRANL